MGAGASISDLDELKAGYEKDKASLPPAKALEIEKLYLDLEAQKKNEFLIIGKTRKMFQEAVEGTPDPLQKGAPSSGGLGLASAEVANFLAKSDVDASVPDNSTDETTELKPLPPPIEGVLDFALQDLETFLLSIIHTAKKTPLLCDASEHKKVDTFFGYGGLKVTSIDAKKLGLQRTMNSKPVEEILEEIRKIVVYCMKGGTPLCLSMSNSVFDVVGAFNSESTFPLDLFESAGLQYVNAPSLGKLKEGGIQAIDNDNTKCAKLYKEEELAENGGIAICREGFCFFVSSNFEAGDLEDFIFKPGEAGVPYGLPSKDKFGIMRCLS